MFSVAEENIPDGYISTIIENDTNDFTITNTHELEKTSVSVNKVWDDADN